MNFQNEILALTVGFTLLGGITCAQDDPVVEGPPSVESLHEVRLGMPSIVEFDNISGFLFDLTVDAPGLYEFVHRNFEDGGNWSMDGNSLANARVHLQTGTYRMAFVAKPLGDGSIPTVTVYRTAPYDAAEPNDEMSDSTRLEEDIVSVVLAPSGDWDWFEWNAPEPGRIIFFEDSRNIGTSALRIVAVNDAGEEINLPPPDDAASDTFGPWRVEEAGPVNFRISADGIEDYVSTDLEILFLPDSVEVGDLSQIQVVGIELSVESRDRLDAIISLSGGQFVNVDEVDGLALQLSTIAEAIEEELVVSRPRGPNLLMISFWAALLFVLGAVGILWYVRRRRIG